MKTLGRRVMTIAAVSAIAAGTIIGTGAASGAATQPKTTQPKTTQPKTTQPKTTAGLHAHLPGQRASGRSNAVASTIYGAGYYSYPGEGNGVASASTSFKMPTFTCKSATDQEWLLPGIWVYNASSALTEQVDVNFNCNDGALTENAVICVSTAACSNSLAVAPHDTIRASLAYTATATIGTVKDVTAKTSAQVVGAAVTTDYTVFIGDEGPSLFAGGVVLKVPTFSTIKFSANQINGEDLSDFTPPRYNLKTTTAVQIRTGALAANQSFVTTFAHN